MIKKLLVFITLICWGIIVHGQNSIPSFGNPIKISNGGVYGSCFSADAVGYNDKDGVYYYNYSKTTKVSTSTDVQYVQMTGKFMFWMEKDVSIYSLYCYDGIIKKKISTTAVSVNEVKVSPDYFMWIGLVGSTNQVFRYNKVTGVTTQLTTETQGCSRLMITDPKNATFSFAYITPNTLKSGYYNLISSYPGTTRKVVFDEYSADGITSGGYIFFTRYTNGISEVLKSNPTQTGANTITWDYNTSLAGSSDKYVAVSSPNNGTQYKFFVIDAVTEKSVFTKVGTSQYYNFQFSLDKFCWIEYDGHDYEIMYFNGKREIQITNNESDDYFAFVNNAGNVVWYDYGLPSAGGSIRHYDASTGATSQVNQEPGTFYNLQGTADAGSFLVLNATSISDFYLYSVSPYKITSLDLRCDETSKNGTAFISIEKPLNPGVIGIDFKMTFDPAAVSVGSVDILNPTDANGNTAALTYSVSGNTLTISYYLKSAAGGSSITATGPIFGINLVRNATTTYTSNYSLLKVTDIDESNAIGILKGTLPVSAAYNISPETFVGQLLYGGNIAKPMVHSATNPAALYQSDYACIPQPLTPAVVNPGTNGIFRINKNTINTQLQFVKELPGNYNVPCSSSNIMTYMNGSDWALAADISKGNSSAVTSPLQYIAADVNMDGRVSAGDAALISSRSVLKICEYPQTWNYVLQNGLPVPGPNYKPSKDFVFVHESAFTVTASKNAVPPVTDCLPMPATQICPSVSDALATKYAGILLGDVNLSYVPSNALSRIGAVNEVVFSKNENPFLINVSGVASEILKSVDFRMILPEGTDVEDVIAANPAVNLNWNTIDSLLMVTSYLEGDSAAVAEMFQIKLKNGLANNLTTGDFFVNGEPAGFSNRIVNGTTDQGANRAKLSPNPTDGTFVLEFREVKQRSVTVSDMDGKVISREKAESISFEVDINAAPAGVYFVKVESTDNTEVYKVVKQ